MPNINDLFPSKYLKASEIPETDLPLTISHVEVETIGQGEDAEQKPVLYFVETKKGFVANKTNCGTIAKLHGPQTEGWAGKRITLFATEVDYAGQQTLAIRVRMRAPAPAQTPTPTTAPADPLAARWAELAKQAQALGVPVPDLDPAIEREDFIKAGKALAAAIDKAKGPF